MLSQILDKLHLGIIIVHWERSEQKQKKSFPPVLHFLWCCEGQQWPGYPSRLEWGYTSQYMDSTYLILVCISIARLGSCNRMDTQAHLWVSDWGKAAALLSSEHSFIQTPDCVALRACFLWMNQRWARFLFTMYGSERAEARGDHRCVTHRKCHSHHQVRHRMTRTLEKRYLPGFQLPSCF